MTPSRKEIYILECEAYISALKSDLDAALKRNRALELLQSSVAAKLGCRVERINSTLAGVLSKHERHAAAMERVRRFPAGSDKKWTGPEVLGWIERALGF